MSSTGSGNGGPAIGTRLDRYTRLGRYTTQWEVLRVRPCMPCSHHGDGGFPVPGPVFVPRFSGVTP